MYCVRFLAMVLFLSAGTVAQEAVPDWSKRTFAAPPDQVFAAALKSIAAQHHDVKSRDEARGLITFHVGITAWSWGYNMVLKVASTDNLSSDVSVEIARAGGKTVSWGSGKKEVLKIFNGIEKELAKTLPATTEPKQATVNGVTNFRRLGTTVACAGATKAGAIPEIKKLGYQSIINLRQATEPGAELEAEEAAAKAAGIRYYQIPFDAAAPDPAAVDKFLDVITTSGNAPAFIHCGGGGRAASMWFIKRLVVDHWTVERAETEAVALGMTNPALKQFAIDYAKTHQQ